MDDDESTIPYRHAAESIAALYRYAHKGAGNASTVTEERRTYAAADAYLNCLYTISVLAGESDGGTRFIGKGDALSYAISYIADNLQHFVAVPQ